MNNKYMFSYLTLSIILFQSVGYCNDVMTPVVPVEWKMEENKKSIVLDVNSKLSPKERAKLCWEIGSVLFSEKKYSEAEPLYALGESLTPKNTKLHSDYSIMRAQCLEHSGKNKEAIDIYKQYVSTPAKDLALNKLRRLVKKEEFFDIVIKDNTDVTCGEISSVSNFLSDMPDKDKEGIINRYLLAKPGNQYAPLLELEKYRIHHAPGTEKSSDLISICNKYNGCTDSSAGMHVLYEISVSLNRENKPKEARVIARKVIDTNPKFIGSCFYTDSIRANAMKTAALSAFEYGAREDVLKDIQDISKNYPGSEMSKMMNTWYEKEKNNVIFKSYEASNRMKATNLIGFLVTVIFGVGLFLKSKYKNK